MAENDKKVVICIFPFAMPGSGKSFFFKQLTAYLDTLPKELWSYSKVSSDEIRGKLVQQVMAEKSVDKDKAF